MDFTLDSFDAVRFSERHLEPAFDVVATGEKELARLSPEAIEALRAQVGHDHEKVVRRAGLEVAGRYFNTRDLSELCFSKPPVKFRVQRPDPVWLAAVGSITTMTERRLAAFRAWCHLVHQDEKPLLEATAPERKGLHTLQRGMADSWIAPDSFLREVSKRWGHETILEIGHVVLAFAELTEEQRGPFGPWGGSVARPGSLA